MAESAVRRADIPHCKRQVRFTPESGHVQRTKLCPLWARSGHETNLVCHSYSMTASARARTAGGIVRPSSLAVLRLTTSSYLVGVCTGRSPGFSPLRMRFDIASRLSELVNVVRPVWNPGSVQWFPKRTHGNRK